ncbi:MAG TPA: superoxide dismutase [Sphingomicrobium sp.]|nr:superoxide dismutase [Sphingomicrobium sp.]
MAFTVPDLPYAFDALAPTIDEATMKLHHDKHHQAYVDKLNDAVTANPELGGKGLEDLVRTASSQTPVVRNNGGGHWNHCFFWESMAPDGGQPQGELTGAIESSFGSLDSLKEKFNAAGVGQFGSGWVWLVARYGQGLEVIATPNQDNPLMDVVPGGYTPILGNDVWEHAYYLTYNNRRADYLKAWWDVVNWNKVSERLAAIG